VDDPRTIVDALEKGAVLPDGTDERFTGYGVMGITFDSGHVLCMRRFPVTSIGPGYTSIWHRDPEGIWVFIQDQRPELSCPRYFGSVVTKQMTRHIGIEWPGPHDLVVEVEGDYSLHWHITLADKTPSRVMNTLSGLIPGAIWRSRRALEYIGRAGSAFMGSGRMTLTGRVPNGQWIMSRPMYMWPISSSTARVKGVDLGRPAPLARQANLGDVWIPQEGRFFVAQVVLETFDPARHLSVTSMGG